MSKSINGIVLTEKGALKNAVREAIVAKAVPSIETALADLDFSKDKKNSFTCTYVDAQGNEVYATLTLTVGTTAPDERKERKTTKKKAEPEVFTID